MLQATALFALVLLSGLAQATRPPSLFSAVFSYLETSIRSLLDYIWPSPQGRVSYKKWEVVRVGPLSKEEAEEVTELAENEDGLEVWGPLRPNSSLELLLPKSSAARIRATLAKLGVDFAVLNYDLEALMKRLNPRMTQTKRVELKSKNGHDFTWTRYHRYQDILRYMDHLVSTAPHLVKTINMGKTSQGRPLKVVRVGNVSSHNPRRPAIWIDAGMHGREWIAPAVASYLMRQLVEGYESNKVLVETLDWYIMPVANPDGYEYTHTTDRLWRKTRSKSRSARWYWDWRECLGVDLASNFDFHWSPGSGEACSPTYPGAKPFSEPEARAIASLIKKIRPTAYISLHSYSQMLFLPWGFTSTKPKDYDDLLYVGRKALEALSKVHGTEYSIGSSPSHIYPSSGRLDDWVKARVGTKYSYTMELRDRGSYGFLLPPQQILPTARETFAAIKSIARSVLDDKHLISKTLST